MQHRAPTGLSAGFVQFAYPGSRELRGGIAGALDDENSILYDTPRAADMKKIIDYIEERRRSIKAKNNVSVSSVSSADELGKYKTLLDQGVITQEEFDAKKKQLLGL